MLKNVLETSRTTQIAMKWKTVYMPTSYNSVEKASHWKKNKPLEDKGNVSIFFFFVHFI